MKLYAVAILEEIEEKEKVRRAMKEQMEQAWNKFFGKGWIVNNVPDKKECFKAGFEAARFLYQNQKEPVLTQVTLNGEVKLKAEE